MTQLAERSETYQAAFEAFRRDPAFGGNNGLGARRERAFGRFPRLDAQTELFAAGGFSFLGIEHVPEATAPGATVADWVRKMRHADTLLGGLTDDEIAAGLARLDEIGDSEIAGPTLETAVYGL